VLKRPGKFIWNYTSPSPQRIVADGQSIWLYDIELEQVTVSPLSEQGAGTPLSLLMGDKPLEQEFELKPLGQSDGIDWVELKPKSSDSDFELVYLGLKGGALAAMDWQPWSCVMVLVRPLRFAFPDSNPASRLVTTASVSFHQRVLTSSETDNRFSHFFVPRAGQSGS